MPFDFNRKLIRGSIVLLVSFGIYNFFNFLFHFSMIRMLKVTEYGVLASLFSIIYVLGVFSESIQLVIAKYTSKLRSKGRMKNILKKSLKKSLTASALLFGVYLLIAIPLAHFLKIEYLLLAINGLIIFIAFLSPVTRGILQGTKKFNQLGLNMITESAIKILLAILLVYSGWKVYGAIIGTLIGASVAFVFSLVSLKEMIRTKEKKAKTAGIYGYTLPAFVVIMTVLAFCSLDIIIAKIVFSDEQAGFYAIASTLAKTLFFGTLPISKAMFPLSAESVGKKKSKNTFLNSLILVFIIIVPVLILFYIFPGTIIKIFSGKEILISSGILFYVGVGMALTSLSNLILLHKLSKSNIRNYWLLPIFIVLEIFLLYIFSSSLVEFSVAFAVSSAMFLLGSCFLLDGE